MIRLAFTEWRLTPAAFWALTPRELAACLAPPRRAAAIDAVIFDRLMRRFPDRRPTA